MEYQGSNPDDETEKIKALCWLEDGFVVLRTSGADYDIPLARCTNAEHLLGWVYQLSQKTWVTVPQLNRFITIVSQKQNISIRC